MRTGLLLSTALLFSALYSCAQPLNKKTGFTRQDTLRGTITPERAWWDVVQYNISVTPDYASQSIQGQNEIHFKVLNSGTKMQLDLQQPMQLQSVVWRGQTLPLQREGNVYFITFPQALQKGTTEKLQAHFTGTPRAAKNPPWDGGWIWKQDAQNRPWMSVAVQGLGASAWYPCKDHQSDEPDSGALFSITVADTLVAVANGNFKNKQSNGNGTTTYQWQVVNPINNYNIIPYVGKYVNFTEVYQGEKGPLACSYWVLDYNLEKAKAQFVQAAQTLKAFEHWFGPYPFYEDGFKLVESPHLGMEHQSAVAYGNKYQNGYLGRDLSGSGWGLKWDFIIVHEVGHEWFGNNITAKDIADMWVHEGFTSYSETLFTEYHFGKEGASAYIQGVRRGIQNDIPIIGHYGVNQEGSGDMYSKAANMLHTIRQIIADDAKFRNILRGLNQTFYHQTVTTKQVEDYIIKQSGKDLQKIFDQYLRHTNIPVLELQGNNYRWTNCIKGFNMPVRLTNGQWITPSTEWKEGTKTLTANDIDKNFYIQVKA